MAYSADTFVADEQPTTAKWNKLWSNDASFNDGTGLANMTAGGTTAVKNSYKFFAYRNGAFNLTVAYAKVQFETELFDTGSNYDNATNYRFTAPIAGFYQFQWLVGGPISGTTDTVSTLYKNGTILVWGNEIPAGGTGGSALVSAAASDYFEIFVVSSGTIAANVGSAPIKTYFSGFYVSST